MIYQDCIAAAATAYDVPVAGIVAYVTAPHKAGLGIMGIPPSWADILARVGFNKARLASSPCENIAAGTWIMAFEGMKAKTETPPVATATAAAPPGNASGVSPACIASAAKDYNLPLALLDGILATEGGHIGQVHWNANGSYDMGPAQINSTWLPQLAHVGITKAMVINDGCLNVHIGAWILAQAMQGANPNQPGQFWRHVGDYNSATPVWNARYARLVWEHIAQ